MWNEVREIVASDINNFPEDLMEKAGEEDIHAIYQIARLYEQGLEVPMDDTKAFHLFELCASQGMLDAQIRVADKLFRGQGISKNSEKAKEILAEAIKNNKVMAWMLMGDILQLEHKKAEAIAYYLNAEKIFQTDNQNVSDYTMAIMYGKMSELYLDENKEIHNLLKSVQYLDKALKQDVFCNAKAIGDLFYYGNGIEKDLKKAEFYYERIAREDICDGCGGNCKKYCQKKIKEMKVGDIMAVEGSIWLNICYEKYDAVRELINNNEFDPNYRESGKSLLHLIAETLEIDIAKSLLDRGADVDIRDAWGNTPVIKALFEYDRSDFKDDAMVKLFFEYGASKEAVNDYGEGVQKMLETVRKYSGKTLSWLD